MISLDKPSTNPPSAQSPTPVEVAPTDVGSAQDWTLILDPLPSNVSGSMAIGESVAAALQALRTNMMRAFLTTLGIVIGVSAVIVMIALGAGAQESIQSRLAGLGTNLLTISPGAGSAGGVRAGSGSLPSLNEQDVLAIQQQIPGIEAISPNLNAGNTQVVAGTQNWNTQVQANYPSIFTIQNWQVASGAAYDETDETNANLVCVIGQTVATNLFNGEDPVGQRILIRNVPFTVKGVLVSKGSNGFRDQDDIILMPYSTAQIRLFHLSYVNSVLVQVAASQDTTTVQQDITSLLETRHNIQSGQPDDFRVINNQEILQTVQQTTQTFTWLLAGVASVSLLVGGIGIMNIMLVSVTERTREIGIRLAIGARPSNILGQFLIEAIVLSVIGGILGILVGAGGSILASRLAGWNTLVTPEAVLLAVGFSTLVGIFFGFYPARKASQLDPIEALRYE